MKINNINFLKTKRTVLTIFMMLFLTQVTTTSAYTMINLTNGGFDDITDPYVDFKGWSITQGVEMFYDCMDGHNDNTLVDAIYDSNFAINSPSIRITGGFCEYGYYGTFYQDVNIKVSDFGYINFYARSNHALRYLYAFDVSIYINGVLTNMFFLEKDSDHDISNYGNWDIYRISYWHLTASSSDYITRFEFKTNQATEGPGVYFDDISVGILTPSPPPPWGGGGPY